MSAKRKSRENDENVAAWLGDAAGKAGDEPVLQALDALYAHGPGPQAVRAAQARLRRGLSKQKEGDLWYSSVASPFGRVYYAATTEGLVAVDFDVPERNFLEQVQARFGRLPARAPQRLAGFGRQLAEYLAGERAAFDLPLDLARLPDFQRQVLFAAMQIPRGEVVTYGEIARRIGRPRASRAVGQALGHNPIPIVIPCHRVVGSDGSLRGYGAGRGIETKAKLLQLEGARRAA